MYPLEFTLIPQKCCPWRIWECIYEIYYMYLHISSTIVVRLFEMSADVCLLPRIFGLNGVEMCLNSVHASKFGLSHILHFAFFAGDTVNYIWTLAGDIFLSQIAAPSKCANDPP